MPYINISLFEGNSQDKKEQIARKITKVINEELSGVPDQNIWITFTDIPKADWSIGGRMCDK